MRTAARRAGQRASSRAKGAAIAGLGGFLAIALLAAASEGLGTTLLVASFGASAALVFAMPQAPVSQPANVIGGHLVSTLVGLVVLAASRDLPEAAGPIALGAGVGIAIAAMILTNTMHPPAGGDPILVIVAGASWHFLLAPMLVGTLAIVLVGIAYHRLVSGSAYPQRVKATPANSTGAREAPGDQVASRK